GSQLFRHGHLNSPASQDKRVGVDNFQKFAVSQAGDGALSGVEYPQAFLKGVLKWILRNISPKRA
ncbi:MAG: hypothetical protein K8R91_01530, partial [Phycisphaerae bacterium]|nr:hypothetical protein [Phycisphaerae bacterium]